MYRVMIVDDEEPVLESFSFVIRKHIKNFTLCGTARSGTEAVRLVPELKPDLVFMDIHMPGMDGIDAITEIRQIYPDTVFILATAYERFDIAQRAIPLGIFSYLVKPVSRNALIHEFSRVEGHLDQARRKFDSHIGDVKLLQKSRQEARERFLSGLLWSSPSSEAWEEFQALFSLSCEGGMIAVLKACDGWAREYRNDLFRQVDEKISYKYDCYSHISRQFMLLFFPDNQDLLKLDTGFRSVLADFPEMSIAKGSVCGFDRLHVSFTEAMEQLHSFKNKCQSYSDIQKVMEGICELFFRSEFDRAKSEFEEFWTDIFLREDFSVAKARMVAFFTLLFCRIDRNIFVVTGMDIDPSVEIMVLESVDEWRQWIHDYLALFCGMLSGHQASMYPQPLVRALGIIRESYDRPLKLSDVAAECRITACYLSRLFTECLHSSFTSYLNKYRIDRAVVHLRDEGLSIKEAAMRAGFRDPNYFARIFRRYMGVTPTDIVHRRSYSG